MPTRRARQIVGLISLLALSSCVLLSGLGDLEIDKDASDGSVAGFDGTAQTDGGSSNGDSGPVFPGFDGSFPGFDGHFPFDSSLPDVNQPDTGGPETGPAGAGVVQCSASLQCTDGKVCCYSAFFPVPSCSAMGQGCVTGGAGIACDDDSDCAGQVCCITPELISYSASSSCKASCGQGSFHACATSDTCSDGTTCKHVNLAPGPIKGCQ